MNEKVNIGGMLMISKYLAGVDSRLVCNGNESARRHLFNVHLNVIFSIRGCQPQTLTTQFTITAIDGTEEQKSFVDKLAGTLVTGEEISFPNGKYAFNSRCWDHLEKWGYITSKAIKKVLIEELQVPSETMIQ